MCVCKEPTIATDENNTLRVKMILKRRIINVASNTFLPVILIILVSFYFEFREIAEQKLKCNNSFSLIFCLGCIFYKSLCPSTL